MNGALAGSFAAVLLLALGRESLSMAGVVCKGSEAPRKGPSADFSHGDLKISENRRFIVHADGTPFLWLADTAWELFHRLTREEAELYLENRRQKGFTVIQAVALAELDGLNTPNPYGHTPLIDNDPTRPAVREGPDNDYWDHVDWIIDRAASKGIFIGLLPTWGDKVVKKWGVGPEIFNEQNARIYGEFIGSRYANRPNIVWILGGDRNEEGKLAIWRAMAEGIRSVDTRHLITYHPQGDASSSYWFHNEAWLDFNLLQSGHSHRDKPNYAMIERDYNLRPVKPCLDGEPRYEDHPVNWQKGSDWFDDFDVRQAAYWALFAGAFGHTYGCHDIWQMWQPGRQPMGHARTPWRQALDFPGAFDMMHVRRLLLSRPFLTRVPDQALIVSGQQEGAGHVRATRDSQGSYAFVYIPCGQKISVDCSRLSAKEIVAWWFDPRTGDAIEAGRHRAEMLEFCPPGGQRRGNDWVLVLDDSSRDFAPPGRVED